MLVHSHLIFSQMGNKEWRAPGTKSRIQQHNNNAQHTPSSFANGSTAEKEKGCMNEYPYKIPFLQNMK